jgi:hypothetical protein
MFTELSEELLDLAVHEQGYRNALYAKIDPGGCSSCTGSSSSLTCCKTPW